jgi:hypothetical protein
MFGLVRKLFGAPPSRDAGQSFGDRDQNPVAVAGILGAGDGSPRGTGSAREGQLAKPDYDAFRATFCCRPGRKLADVLEAEGVTRLTAWLHWGTPEPEPKAFIRLMLELMRRGESIWDQSGISLYVEGRWSQGGGPSRESQDALSVLAQILAKPIKVYYEKRPGDPMAVMEFQP